MLCAHHTQHVYKYNNAGSVEQGISNYEAFKKTQEVGIRSSLSKSHGGKLAMVTYLKTLGV